MTGQLWWPDDLLLREQAGDDGLWSAYCTATVQLDLPSGRVLLSPRSTAVEQRPPAGSLHVVTAYDPASSGRREDDHARMRLLQAEIQPRLWFPARGGDITGDHEPEPSLAVAGLTDDQARELGRRFGQVAVFAWSGPTWSVLACATPRRSDLGWTLARG